MGRDRIRVVAAVIFQDGKVLICQRKAGDSHALEWEFPGGKVESKERLEHALARELEEELAIQARIGRELYRQEFQYPGRKPLLLVFYRVDEFYGEPVNQVFEQIRWEEPARLRQYAFLAGDRDFIERLSQGEFDRAR